MVELQIVVLAVAGSSPVGHPVLKIPKKQTPGSKIWNVEFTTWDFGFQSCVCSSTG